VAASFSAGSSRSARIRPSYAREFLAAEELLASEQDAHVLVAWKDLCERLAGTLASAVRAATILSRILIRHG